jgi:hypothetical protein
VHERALGFYHGCGLELEEQLIAMQLEHERTLDSMATAEWTFKSTEVVTIARRVAGYGGQTIC